MNYQPIENYGIIGNMRTAALVGMNGSIDWFCFPHFDSPSVFAAILDDEQRGTIRDYSCSARDCRSKQFYLAGYQCADDPLPFTGGESAKSRISCRPVCLATPMA